MCQVYGPSYSVQCDMCGNSMRNTDDICPHCKHNFAAVNSDTPKVTHHLNCPFPIYPCECNGNTRNPALSFEQSVVAGKEPNQMTSNKVVPQHRTPKPCIHCEKTLHNFHGPFARCEGGKTQYEASPSMTEDFSYTRGSDGFVAIMPNTPAAVDTYNRMYSDGVYRLMPHEFAAFKTQAKRAGYTVRKSKPVSIDSLDLSLLNS